MTAPGDFFRCIDSNECSQDVAACEEGRVCLDLRGGFRCVAVEEQCTQANNFGGCYVSDLAPVNGGPRSACVSRVSEFRARAAGGDVSVDGAPTFNCSCAALPCHTGDGVTCEQLCPLEECLNRNNPAISTCVIAPESRAQPPPRLCACARVACSCAAAMQSSCVAIALERSACGTRLVVGAQRVVCGVRAAAAARPGVAMGRAGVAESCGRPWQTALTEERRTGTGSSGSVHSWTVCVCSVRTDVAAAGTWGGGLPSHLSKCPQSSASRGASRHHCFRDGCTSISRVHGSGGEVGPRTAGYVCLCRLSAWPCGFSSGWPPTTVTHPASTPGLCVQHLRLQCCLAASNRPLACERQRSAQDLAAGSPRAHGKVTVCVCPRIDGP